MFGFPGKLSRRLLRTAAASLSLVSVLAYSTSSANAGPGYERDSAKPSIALGGEFPLGLAVDQSSQVLYVAEVTTDFFNVGHGQIEQLSASGVATANSPFGTGNGDYFTGVAVNPVTQGIYAYQTQLTTPLGVKGSPQMNTFSSTGVETASFTPTLSTIAQLAADSSGRIYYPNDTSDSVQIFSSTGSLDETIVCSGCAGGAFIQPKVAALEAAGNL
jgi:hypothetical protein